MVTEPVKLADEYFWIAMEFTVPTVMPLTLVVPRSVRGEVLTQVMLAVSPFVLNDTRSGPRFNVPE